MANATSSELDTLRDEAARCTNCELYKDATQTVFGEGAATARVVLVGEQPGDREDIEGHPFVGPAGGVLDEALKQAGLDRTRTYVTNAVKHFKWTPRGKRRIHETPRASEIRACKQWLEAEVGAVKPDLVVALGATAVSSLLGPGVRVLANRGHILESTFGPCLVTVHPSSILRTQTDEERRSAMAAFIEDLKQAKAYLDGA